MANICPIHTNSKYQPYSYKWLMSALFTKMANVSHYSYKWLISALFIQMANVSPIHRNG